MLGCRLLSLCVRRLTCWLSGSPCWLLTGAGSLRARLLLRPGVTLITLMFEEKPNRIKG